MRKNILYADRIKGDVDLGLEPSRTRGTVKDWARMDFPGGQLDGGSDQEVWEESITQNYRIGTRRVQDQRTFHYCQSNPTYGIERPYYGCRDMNQYKADGTLDCLDNVVSGAHAAGGYTLLVLDDTAHAADAFAGGWVFLRTSVTWWPQWYRVRSNTAQSVTGTSVTLTLWDPLVYPVADTRPVTVYPSIYSNVQMRHAVGSYTSATVCVAIIGVTAGYYFWGQTWGMCIATPNIEVPGVNDNERRLVFNFEGSVRLPEAAAATKYRQQAGQNLFPTPTDAQTEAWFPYMLQITP